MANVFSTFFNLVGLIDTVTVIMSLPRKSMEGKYVKCSRGARAAVSPNTIWDVLLKHYSSIHRVLALLRSRIDGGDSGRDRDAGDVTAV